MKKLTIKNVVYISLFGNITLTIIKLIFGLIGSSQSLFSDGINSFVDIFISLMLIIVLNISNKKADENHPYGHQKYEGILYLFLSLIIIGIAVILGYQSVMNLTNTIHNVDNHITPNSYTLIVASVALIIKVYLYIINYRTAKLNKSVVLYADSKNHLFDIFSTTLSLLSIGLSLLGLLYFEEVASIIISLFIFYAGVKMIMDSISYLVDEAPSIEIIASIKKSIESRRGVLKVDDLKVRKHMQNLYVDVEISVDSQLSLKQAHHIAEVVHDYIESKFDVIHCMVHVNPYRPIKK